ncbi:hypothetical protein NP493_1017g02051 [Ridgeia piscesae]|uniref:GYF domain-containing protein n=1 Tax=Ridgeia piscesae TaxID=27915 RepID=A0AAD9KIE6_RIDPI|nr:hypothetical protein NP493_1017g02051 [Ridgeia piscesae]
MDANGVRILVDLLTLAHLHTTRATVPLQTNVIEAAPDSHRESEKEWYFGNADKERLGPYSFMEMKDFWKEGMVNAKTRCWAQGMDGWRPLVTVSQLKWCLLATGQAVMNETDLAVLVLNMLIKMCGYYPSRDVDDAVIRPMPRIKRLLSEAICLPHIVQLLLTFDPILVEKVATLLNLVMQDNPTLSRLYLTGVFYFIMMYTGSNVLPVARFLKYTHAKQAFRSDEVGCQHACLHVQFSSVQFSSVQFSSVQFSSVQFSSVQFSSAQLSSVQLRSAQLSSAQLSSAQLSSVQFRQFITK